MSHKIISLFIACVLAATAQAGVLLKVPFAGSTVELLDSAGAAAANGKSDAYSQALTPFDLQIRLGIASGATEKDYLARAASQARSWTKEEQAQLKQAFAEIETFLKAEKIKLDFPASIQVIKTAGKEEFEAEGYTRLNHITLCTASGPISVHLVAHELFHVYSRFNIVKRDELYAIFGFRKSNKIDVNAAMDHKAITNPDCPVIEHYITVKTQEGTLQDLVLVLYTTKEYDPKYSLGDYMNLGLLAVTGGTDKNKRPLLKEGKGVLFQVDQMPDLFRQISGNTPYIIHPEEITAEHFAMWIAGKKVPQPQFFDRMKAVLAKGKKA